MRTYANWHDAEEGIQCEKVQKLHDHDLKIIRPLVVDGKSYEERVVSGHDQLESLEKRCFTRHE